eukprot:TRINITY_DN35644_c0_g1_i3.p2 TRINITY_DN35644_c0_g1~~TRINITY_DN35644_c0_g1_i3.p2  ORF type:complete len:114 (-),score=1.29 TRINITY_DN35644_c0_g1_i3:17-358(-)
MGIDENNVYNCQRYCDLVSIVLIKSNEIHSGKKCIQNFSQVQIHGKFRNLFLYFGYKIFALGSSGHSNLCSVEAHSKVQNQVGILSIAEISKGLKQGTVTEMKLEQGIGSGRS